MPMGHRWKIDDVDIIANDSEVWFVQDEKVCWTTREELWSSSSKLSQILREKGYRIQSQRFPRQLRELILSLSKDV